MMKSDYVEPGPSKPTPPLPVRVSRKSELIAALRQRARSIVIENQELARPFVRLLRARELRSWHADTRSDSIGASYGADIEAQMVHGPICAAGKCAESDPQTKKG